jgi:hypothetical protein
MRIQQFLEHHGVVRNPFAEEDAQSDPVFKEHCIHSTHHPAWDKIYGDPREPATSVVLGEKGAGKTALRLQIAEHLTGYSRAHAGKRPFVIHYDDFNPFLDRFVSRLPARRRRIDRALSQLRLWDHMDAILSLGVTDLVDQILTVRKPQSSTSLAAADLDRLDSYQRRDLLLLAACYDQSLEQPYLQRWHRLRRQLKYWALRARLSAVIGWVTTAAVLVWITTLLIAGGTQENLLWIRSHTPAWAYLVVLVLGWLPWLATAAHRGLLAWSVARGLRVVNRPIHSLRRVLMWFTAGELSGQPLPNRDRTDDRYELLTKLQSVLQTLNYQGVFVLVDRVDEPYLINGSADLMKALIWPLLDNKLLKHPGLGIKLMLPAELKYFIEREGRDFAQRARLDKQNMVPSLAWTGEALFDVANARLRACASEGREPAVQQFFEPAVTRQRLLDGFRQLRVPRHLHKFLHQLLVSHCNAYTDEDPQWAISKERFESELALYERDLAEQRF